MMALWLRAVAWDLILLLPMRARGGLQRERESLQDGASDVVHAPPVGWWGRHRLPDDAPGLSQG